jgi:hypothetical protein
MNIDRPCTRIFVALILLVHCPHSVLKHCALRLHVRYRSLLVCPTIVCSLHSHTLLFISIARSHISLCSYCSLALLYLLSIHLNALIALRSYLTFVALMLETSVHTQSRVCVMNGPKGPSCVCVMNGPKGPSCVFVWS